MSPRGRVAAFATSVALSGLTACVTSPPPDEQGPSKPAAVASSAAPAAPVLDPHTRGWEFGKWYAYSLKMTSSVSFAEGPHAIDFDVTGLVQITPTEVTPETATLYIAMPDPKVISRIAGSQPEFDRIAKTIAASGCFLTFSGGLVTEMRAPRGFSATAANTYRAVGAALQFAHAGGPGPYEVHERDTTGEYVASYQFEEGPQVWHKAKERYIDILAAKRAPANAPAHVVPHVIRSDGTITLLPGDQLGTVELTDELTIQGAQAPVHSSTTISLRAGPAEATHQPGPDWDALMSGMAITRADEPYGGGTSIESLDKARIADMTFDKAVEGLEALVKAQKPRVVSVVNGAPLDPKDQQAREQSVQQESKLFTALAAILREHPEDIPRTIRLIHAKSPASDILVEALSSASNPAAERALVDLAASTSDPMRRNRILMALSRTARPDVSAIKALKGMLKDDPFNEQALLGLGTYSRRLRDSGAEDQATAIGELLVERLRAARVTTEHLTALRAITNSGYAPALTSVLPYLKGGQEEIRVAAVRALQSMQDPRVDPLLAESIRSDPSEEVRISALSAAKVRDSSDTLVSAVKDMAGDEAIDPHLRYRAVELLAAWSRGRADLRSTLEKVAKNDGEVRIRDLAQSAL